MSSRDAFAASNLQDKRKSNAAEDTTSQPPYPGKFRYQRCLLEELEKKVPANDPFLPDVLDRYKLLASRRLRETRQSRNQRPGLRHSVTCLLGAFVSLAAMGMLNDGE